MFFIMLIQYLSNSIEKPQCRIQVNVMHLNFYLQYTEVLASKYI